MTPILSYNKQEAYSNVVLIMAGTHSFSNMPTTHFPFLISKRRCA